MSEVGELLADLVVPLGYAVRGGPLATDLWRYKSEHAGREDAAAATRRLGVMLADFLAHADAAWAAAGMSAGPSRVAVVPSGQGRPGAHPLERLAAACFALPLVRLATEPREIHTRGVNPGWVRVGDPVADADVVVVDDTWVSGGSAQSVAAALKLAGARRVAVIVLGRHVNPADPRSAAFLAAAKNSAQAVPWRAAASS
ncbi:MAG: hypothetical protein ACRDNS_20500 [Trebonia sp.]